MKTTPLMIGNLINTAAIALGCLLLAPEVGVRTSIGIGLIAWALLPLLGKEN